MRKCAKVKRFPLLATHEIRVFRSGRRGHGRKQSRTGWPPRHSTFNGNPSVKSSASCIREAAFPDLISMSEALPAALNDLSVPVRIQMGSVVTVLSLANNRERDLQTVTHSTLQSACLFSGMAELPRPMSIFRRLEAYCSILQFPPCLNYRCLAGPLTWRRLRSNVTMTSGGAVVVAFISPAMQVANRRNSQVTGLIGTVRN